MSRVTCHMSHVTCHFFFFLDKVVELIGGGSVINGAYPVQFYEKLPNNGHIPSFVDWRLSCANYPHTKFKLWGVYFPFITTYKNSYLIVVFCASDKMSNDFFCKSVHHQVGQMLIVCRFINIFFCKFLHVQYFQVSFLVLNIFRVEIWFENINVIFSP